MSNLVNFILNIYRNIPYVFFINLLRNACIENLEKTIILCFYIRDRSEYGLGERQLGKWAFQWLFLNYPNQFMKIFHLIPNYGRWDDIYCLFPKYLNIDRCDNYLSKIKDTDIILLKKLQKDIVTFIIKKIDNDFLKMKQNKEISLCAKWAITENSSLDYKYKIVKTICEESNISFKQYRKKISQLRKYSKVTERLLCDKQNKEIEYKNVPNGSMHLYKKMFRKKDYKRFQLYLNNFYKNINSKDIHLFGPKIIEYYMSIKEVDNITETQWKNYFEYLTTKISIPNTFVVLDTGGSMYNRNEMSKQVPLHLGIYFSLIYSNLNTFQQNKILNFNLDVLTINKSFNLFYKINEILKCSQKGFNRLNVNNLYLSVFHQVNSQTKITPDRLLVISNKNIDHNDKNWKQNLSKSFELFQTNNLSFPKLTYICLRENINSFYHDEYCEIITGYSKEIINCILYKKCLNSNVILDNILNNKHYNDIKNLLCI